ncbi:MAG: hypothetical protein SGJ04_06615 [Bacteroidota bacterium]|nr:hypothetical protein [Bacteroidota bacterium]
MKTQSYWFICSALFLSCISVAQPSLVKKASAKKIELTKTDLTISPDVNIKNATIYGIGLDMSIRTVYALVNRSSKYIRMEIDPINERHFYLMDNTEADTVKVPLAYLQWGNFDSSLIEIDIYPDMKKYLVKNTQDLLSDSIDNPNSEVVKRFLGNRAFEKVTLNVASIGLKTERYFYSKPRLMIEKQTNNDKTKYILIIYDLE